MNAVGTGVPTEPNSPVQLRARADESPGTGPSAANTPYWLLWSTGIVAFVLSLTAFVLWGIYGAGTLFDMIAALCF
jgi:hypothetical protein